ncbi:MAG: hypothetical protein R3321_14020 [Nitrososphaeraceae archaeon]|nr:hypothetical protein [Nitrososphaeraceae archaeon]
MLICQGERNAIAVQSKNKSIGTLNILEKAEIKAEQYKVQHQSRETDIYDNKVGTTRNGTINCRVK